VGLGSLQKTSPDQVLAEPMQNSEKWIDPNHRLPVFGPHLLQLALRLGESLPSLDQLPTIGHRPAQARKTGDTAHRRHARQICWAEALHHRDDLAESRCRVQRRGHTAASLNVFIRPVERYGEIARLGVALIRGHRGEPFDLEQGVAEPQSQAEFDSVVLRVVHRFEQRKRRPVVRCRLADR